MNHVVIIGNGISGITAARHIRKHSKCKITVISKETKYFYSRTALMYIYMGHMTLRDTEPYEPWFWEKNGIELLQDTVLSIDSNTQSVQLEKTPDLQYDHLILATGSASNKFGWPGQDLEGVQGLYNYQDLLSMEEHTQGITRAVVVGGGLIGIEMVEMLLSRNIPVTFLVRDASFWSAVIPPEEGHMIEEHIKEHHVDLRMETELKEVLPDHKGRARAIVTNQGEEIPCQFVGLTTGVHPNIDFIKNSNIECNRGILIDEYFQTNVPQVYAVGDCAEFKTPLPGRKPIEQVWYTGKMHGETLAQTISGRKSKYTPGIWFNSAKFFDIEYQTYGLVWNKTPEDEGTFFWKDPRSHRCLRINYKKSDQRVVGFNFFGIRARHEVCEDWIRAGRTLREVIERLPQANFDPEFFKSYEQEVIQAYNLQSSNGESISLRAKKGLLGLMLK